MHSLSGIIAMNRRAAAKAARQAETETSRHCSFTKDQMGNIILHSALHRNTVFLRGDDAHTFLADAEKAPSPEILDHLIEGYF